MDYTIWIYVIAAFFLVLFIGAIMEWFDGDSRQNSFLKDWIVVTLELMFLDWLF